MRKVKFFSFVLAILTATPMVAQDDNHLRFGAGFSFVIPTGDLSKLVSAGFGPSVFVEKPFSDNFVLEAGADYIKFGKRAKHDLDMAEWGMYARGDWYFNKHNSAGPYVFAILGFRNATYTWNTDLSHGSENASYLSYGAGFGYTFNRIFSIEFILVNSRFESEIGHLFDKNLRLPSDFLLAKQGKSNAVAKGSPISFVSKELSWAVSQNREPIQNKEPINDGKKLYGQSDEQKKSSPPMIIVNAKK